ncbi:MAG: hypothetical protein GF418_15490 [Chitinivibrionales bacterium]|nr:hypothetical protein [Chitinivibrionales bacterium]MBD3397024.1 hypothetical protein [Chitinivibrionales bacterium]
MAEANGCTIVGYRIENPPFHFRTAHHLDLYNIDFETVLQSPRTVLVLSNASRDVRDRICSSTAEFRGIRILRDPRQVLVSNYFFHKEGHAIAHPSGWIWDQLEEDRPVLAKLPQEDGILYELGSITRDILTNQLVKWNHDGRIIEFKLEEFSRAAKTNLRFVAEHCGFRKVGNCRIKTTHANPGSRHWKDCFTPRITRAFKERYGQLLIDLGYEEDMGWQAGP